MYTPQACGAKIRFGWDDALTFCLNDGEAQALGQHDYFQSREVSVSLEAGDNRLVVLLTNTTGLSRGAWNFSCGITSETGEALVPAIRYMPPETSRAGF